MSFGLAERQGDLLDDVMRFCDEALADTSIYAVLHRERDRLFPDVGALRRTVMARDDLRAVDGT